MGGRHVVYDVRMDYQNGGGFQPGREKMSIFLASTLLTVLPEVVIRPRWVEGIEFKGADFNRRRTQGHEQGIGHSCT